MTGPVNKPVDKDSMARSDSVLNAYKSRAGADAEPPADLDARILAMAAQPARISLSTEAQSAPAARTRVRRMPTWISWAAGAGALILSGGVLRVMLQDSPNPQSVQSEALAEAKVVQLEVQTDARARSQPGLAAIPEESPAPMPMRMPQPLDVPKALADIESAMQAPGGRLNSQASQAADPVASSAAMPAIDVPPPAPAEESAEFIAEATPPRAEIAAQTSPVADAVEEFANEPSIAADSEQELASTVVTGSRIASRSSQTHEQSAPLLSDEETLDAITLAPEMADQSRPMARAAPHVIGGSSAERDTSDSQPYAPKLAQPFDEALAHRPADKSSETREIITQNAVPVAAAAPAQAMPESTHGELAGIAAAPAQPEAKLDSSKKRTAAQLKRAFAKLRKLQRAGDIEALKREIKQFRDDFPRDTEIPADLKAAFDANP